MLRLWGAVQSQWAHGPMGPTGFNWLSLRAHPDVRATHACEREGHLQGLADMERAWLRARARIAQTERVQRTPEGR